MLMKRLACLLLALAMTCLAAGCRWQKQAKRQDWKEIEEKGILRIGVTECAPFSQKGADGSWSGFDMDLAAVCAGSWAGAGICGAGLVRQGGGPESGRSGLPLERHHSPFGSFRDPGFYPDLFGPAARHW